MKLKHTVKNPWNKQIDSGRLYISHMYRSKTWNN